MKKYWAHRLLDAGLPTYSNLLGETTISEWITWPMRYKHFMFAAAEPNGLQEPLQA